MIFTSMEPVDYNPYLLLTSIHILFKYTLGVGLTSHYIWFMPCSYIKTVHVCSCQQFREAEVRWGTSFPVDYISQKSKPTSTYNCKCIRGSWNLKDTRPLTWFPAGHVPLACSGTVAIFSVTTRPIHTSSLNVVNCFLLPWCSAVKVLREAGFQIKDQGVNSFFFTIQLQSAKSHVHLIH